MSETVGSDDAPPPRPRRRPRPADEEKDSAARKRTRRIAIIAGTAALTTAVSGVVGGIVSPERVQSVLGLDDDPSEAGDTGELEVVRITDSTGAIAVDVPESWAHLDDSFVGINGIDSPGLAVRASPDPNAAQIQRDETVYVGASAVALDDLGLVGLDDAAVKKVLEQRREGGTYMADARCAPSSSHAPVLADGWVGASRAWQDCFGVDGWRAIEVEMVSADRGAYVFIQIGLPVTTRDDVAQNVLDSLTVLPSKLPTG